MCLFELETPKIHVAKMFNVQCFKERLSGRLRGWLGEFVHQHTHGAGEMPGTNELEK